MDVDVYAPPVRRRGCLYRSRSLYPWNCTCQPPQDLTYPFSLPQAARLPVPLPEPLVSRPLHLSAACCKVSSGRYKVTRSQNKPLTYEQANPPHFLFVRKGFNSFNTCE